ncbi:MAG: hypothetical protein GEV08_18980 [Acidimicrobiia bacterium]|nr:hypothetical protein [Acidimicrobiia bacterium]
MALLALLWMVVLPAVDEAVPVDQEVAAGTVMNADHGVTIVPPVGWNIDEGLVVADGRPSSDVPPIGLSSGSTTASISTLSWDESLDALLARANEIHEQADEPNWHIAHPAASVTTDSGATGIVEFWESPKRTGRIVVFVDDGVGAQIIVSTTRSEQIDDGDDIDAMVASVKFDGGSA